MKIRPRPLSEANGVGRIKRSLNWLTYERFLDMPNSAIAVSPPSTPSVKSVASEDRDAPTPLDLNEGNPSSSQMRLPGPGNFIGRNQAHQVRERQRSPSISSVGSDDEDQPEQGAPLQSPESMENLRHRGVVAGRREEDPASAGRAPAQGRRPQVDDAAPPPYFKDKDDPKLLQGYYAPQAGPALPQRRREPSAVETPVAESSRREEPYKAGRISDENKELIRELCQDGAPDRKKVLKDLDKAMRDLPPDSPEREAILFYLTQPKLWKSLADTSSTPGPSGGWKLSSLSHLLVMHSLPEEFRREMQDNNAIPKNLQDLDATERQWLISPRGRLEFVRNVLNAQVEAPSSNSASHMSLELFLRGNIEKGARSWTPTQIQGLEEGFQDGIKILEKDLLDSKRTLKVTDEGEYLKFKYDAEKAIELLYTGLNAIKDVMRSGRAGTISEESDPIASSRVDDSPYAYHHEDEDEYDEIGELIASLKSRDPEDADKKKILTALKKMLEALDVKDDDAASQRSAALVAALSPNLMISQSTLKRENILEQLLRVAARPSAWDEFGEGVPRNIMKLPDPQQRDALVLGKSRIKMARNILRYVLTASKFSPADFHLSRYGSDTLAMLLRANITKADALDGLGEMEEKIREAIETLKEEVAKCDESMSRRLLPILAAGEGALRKVRLDREQQTRRVRNRLGGESSSSAGRLGGEAPPDRPRRLGGEALPDRPRRRDRLA